MRTLLRLFSFLGGKSCLRGCASFLPPRRLKTRPDKVKIQDYLARGALLDLLLSFEGPAGTLQEQGLHGWMNSFTSDMLVYNDSCAATRPVRWNGASLRTDASRPRTGRVSGFAAQR